MYSSSSSPLSKNFRQLAVTRSTSSRSLSFLSSKYRRRYRRIWLAFLFYGLSLVSWAVLRWLPVVRLLAMCTSQVCFMGALLLLEIEWWLMQTFHFAQMNSFPPQVVPFALGLWAMATTAGPVLGPIVGGFAAAANGWRWPIWELAWVSGFACIFLAFLLPETFADTILLKRARRLRKLTGNENLRSMSEIKQSEMTTANLAKEALVRPFQLMMEPAVLFINTYVGRESSFPNSLQLDQNI